MDFRMKNQKLFLLYNFCQGLEWSQDSRHIFLEDQNFDDLKIYSSEIKKLENKLIKISDKFIED